MRRTLLLSLVIACSSAGAAAAQEDVGVSRQPVCCGTACCFIDGDCRADGQTNPLNACEECDPGASQDSWTPISGCTPDERDAGGGGGGGGGGGCSVGAGTSAAIPIVASALALVFFAVRRRR